MKIPPSAASLWFDGKSVFIAHHGQLYKFKPDTPSLAARIEKILTEPVKPEPAPPKPVIPQDFPIRYSRHSAPIMPSDKAMAENVLRKYGLLP